MATWNGEPSQATGGDSCNFPPPSGPAPDQAATRAGNKEKRVTDLCLHSEVPSILQVLKSGPLFISSKGIGWTSWKKRWFILTRTSLVFFRADPNAVPQRGSDNLTLGGIDLNNSGSVVVKADKKLLTVLFPDGRDGRTFTLKAETLDDLYEWKTALETALTQAPSATLVTGQNGMLRNDQSEAMDGSAEQLKDKKSMVIGRPILLALEEVDGTPSFLEKALRFIEQHGVKVEGILRQAADVEHVEHRIREYEQGKVDFSPDEDAHVIADCIKYVIRELPSYPVPASCCNALLDVIRIDRERRVNAMRMAICETFPEPNRRLLQRILVMMQRVAAHKAVNRMSPSAVAACMAPLLLRPLLSGDCELEHDFDVGGDGSAQLLQAAAAANHAQGIVMTLLEEYDSIFGEGSPSHELYDETDESGSEGEEEASDDEYYEDDDEEDDDEETDDEEDYEDDEEVDDEEDEESGSETDEDSGSLSSPSRNVDDGVSVHKKVVSSSTSGSQSPAAVHDLKDNHMPSSAKEKPQKIENTVRNHRSTDPLERHSKSAEALEITPRECSALHTSSHTIQKSTSIASGTISIARRPAMLGRTPAKKRSMESVGSIDIDMEKSEIENLEAEKADLVAKIAVEAKENKVLLANLENRKRAFYERRQALQNDVARLQEQLQKERDLMEVGNQDPRKSGPCAATIGEKLKAYLDQLAAAEADMNSLRQKVDNIGKQLIRRGGNRESNNLPQPSKNDQDKVTGKQNESESTRTSQPDEKMTHSKGAAVDTSSPSKDKLQAPTPQQHDSGKQTELPTPQQHDSGKQTQPPLRQLVPVDSKKHRKLQLESVGSLKSRPSEELVNSEADSGKQTEAPTPQQHDSGKQTQPPLRQLVPVDSKKHRKLQLESVGSLKSRPGEELVNSEADSGGKTEAPTPQQHDSVKQIQPPLRQLVPVDSKKHRKLQLESVGSRKSRPSDEFVNSEADSGKPTEAPTPQQHDSVKQTQPPLRQLVPVDSKKHRNLQLESFGSRKSRPSEDLVNSEADLGKQTEAPTPQQHDSGKQTQPPLRQLVPVDSKKHRNLQLESFGSLKSTSSGELVNSEADSGKQTEAPAPAPQQHDTGKQTQPPLRQLVPVDSKKHRKLQLESAGSRKF